MNTVQCFVIIKGNKNCAVIDVDSLLFNKERRAVGKILDVFGPVDDPYFCIRMSDDSHVCTVGEVLYYSPETEEYTSYIFVDRLKKDKGSDASWKHDHEPPDDMLDYSDDEEEARAKVALKEKKKKEKETTKERKDCQSWKRARGASHATDWKSRDTEGCNKTNGATVDGDDANHHHSLQGQGRWHQRGRGRGTGRGRGIGGGGMGRGRGRGRGRGKENQSTQRNADNNGTRSNFTDSTSLPPQFSNSMQHPWQSQADGMQNTHPSYSGQVPNSVSGITPAFSAPEVFGELPQLPYPPPPLPPSFRPSFAGQIAPPFLPPPHFPSFPPERFHSENLDNTIAQNQPPQPVTQQFVNQQFSRGRRYDQGMHPSRFEGAY